MADRAAGHTRLLDLVCGPPGPVPDIGARYRLVEHLATGGQAEVYRAVRLSSGVSSAPVAVKVFRVADQRSAAEQLRQWEAGDAVLMDLNSRGVPGICRRVDGFYGPPPHPPGTPAPVATVPYQVLDYLHGVNLRDYVSQRRGVGARGAARIDALAVLRELATTLRALHRPGANNTSPVVHMDIKPSNVMVLEGGGVRLVDFTAARYHRRDPGTPTEQLAGPAYDVYGFAAVAYYLVTGGFPRGDRSVETPSPMDGITPPPWPVLRSHPLLEAHPVLRDHLHIALADQPGDRPSTAELPVWVNRLAELVRRVSVPDVGLSWTGEPARWQVAHDVPPAPVAAPPDLEPATVKITPPPRTAAEDPDLPPTQAFAATNATQRIPENNAPPPTRGVASVRQPEPEPDPTLEGVLSYDDHHDTPREYIPRGERLAVLSRGWESSAAGALFAFVCWGIWAFSSSEAEFGGLAATFGFVLVVAAGVFALCRTIGRFVWSRTLRRPRRTARPSHITTGIFLGAAGVGFLQQTPWVMALISWLFV